MWTESDRPRLPTRPIVLEFPKIFNFLKLPPLRKPWVQILVLSLTIPILQDCSTTVSAFLRYDYNIAYEEIVWNYSGPIELLKKIFDPDSRLIDYGMIFQQYWLTVLLCILLILTSPFWPNLTGIFATGKPQSNFKATIDWLVRPNHLTLWISVITVLSYTFFASTRIYNSYLKGANSRLASELNSYEKERLHQFESNSNSAKAPICTFHSPNYHNAGIFRQTYLGFYYSVFISGKAKAPEIEKQIRALPKSLVVIRDVSSEDAERFSLIKDQFSRAEVQDIIEKVRQEENLKSAQDPVHRPLDYLKIAFRNGSYFLTFSKSGSSNDLHLGEVKFICSKSPEKLRSFWLDSLLNH